MQRYLVTYETRQQGAIGEFGQTSITVDMHQSSYSTSDIFREASRKLQDIGLELRFPVCEPFKVHHA